MLFQGLSKPSERFSQESPVASQNWLIIVPIANHQSSIDPLVCQFIAPFEVENLTALSSLPIINAAPAQQHATKEADTLALFDQEQ